MEPLHVDKLSTNTLFLSLILISISILTWLKLANRTKINLPPSPPKLPIIGNIHQLGKLPHRSLRDLSRNYGSLLLLHLGHNPTVLISSPDVVREIVKHHDIVFSDRPKITATDILFYGCKDMAFGPYGEYWRQVRKICVVELFSRQRVHSFQFVRDEEVQVLIDKIRGACLKAESVNLSDMLMFVSQNMVSRYILSHKSEGEDGYSKFGQMAKRIMILITGFCIGDLFPYLRWLDVVTGFVPRLKALFTEIDVFLDQIIQERRALELPDQISDRKDFVSIIMQLRNNGTFETDLTQDNIKGILLDMLVGGTDTTTTTTEWMMSELLRHPNVMKKVQQEVRNVMKNKSKVDREDINKMDYLRCVLKETLRLHPAAPLLAARRTSARVELGGYDIPSGTTVMVNAWAIQRDPKWWEKPEEFIPERFMNSSIDFQGQDYHYIPFGYGRRGCPGWSLGISSIEYVIVNLLYWFDWKLPEGEIAENIDMNEIFGLTVAKKVPLVLYPCLIYHFRCIFRYLA